MSAEEKIIHNKTPKKLAILAGGGSLPKLVSDAALSSNSDVFVICFKEQDDFKWVKNTDHETVSLGQVGRILKTLKQQDISDICLIGSIKRPDIKSLKPDIEGAKLLTKIATQNLGDDGLLRFIKTYLESKGLRVWGAHELLPECLANKGVMSKVKPSKDQLKDIQYGQSLCTQIGSADIGQGVIIDNGLVLGVEAIEGTDELIKRCKAYRRGDQGGVLVKLLKPQQDVDLDMPTIGEATIKNLSKYGYAGLAVSENKTLIPHKDKVIELANKHGLFIYGV